METRSVEMARVEATVIPFSSIRWPAVFAGLAVGIGVQLLLMLFGIAAGFAVYGSGGRPDGASLSIAAGVWDTICIVIAAFVGGYVAARSSGLRRHADGAIHGVVAWGAAMLLFAALTGSVASNVIGGILGVSAPQVAARSVDAASIGDLLSSLERGDREATSKVLRERFGLNEEQASQASASALALAGRADAASRPEALADAAQTASTASIWLCVMILLSLCAGAGGGLLGAGSARKRGLHGHFDELRVAHRKPATQHNIPLTG